MSEIKYEIEWRTLNVINSYMPDTVFFCWIIVYFKRVEYKLPRPGGMCVGAHLYTSVSRNNNMRCRVSSIVHIREIPTLEVEISMYVIQ